MHVHPYGIQTRQVRPCEVQAFLQARHPVPLHLHPLQSSSWKPAQNPVRKDIPCKGSRQNDCSKERYSKEAGCKEN